MNREEFISYLNGPARLDKKSLPEINELVREFPFFQSGHMLFLRNLRNLDHIRFGSQLKRSAVYVANREVLYQLLHGEQADLTVASLSEDRNLHQEPATVQEQAGSDEDVIHLDDTQSIEDAPEKFLEENAKPANIFTTGLLDLDESPAAVKPEKERPLPPSDEKHSFANWFDILDRPGYETDSNGDANKRISGQRDLIDKFMTSETRIIPSPVDASDIPDMSRDSVMEKDGLFTETLATIYVKQGYYSKAIFIYRELSLKFPEKSSYFARRISEIGNIINKL